MTRSHIGLAMVACLMAGATSCGPESSSGPCPQGQSLTAWQGIYSRGEMALTCPNQVTAHLDAYGSAWMSDPAAFHVPGVATLSLSARSDCGAAGSVWMSIGLVSRAIKSDTDRYTLSVQAPHTYGFAFGFQSTAPCTAVLDGVSVRMGGDAEGPRP